MSKTYRLTQSEVDLIERLCDASQIISAVYSKQNVNTPRGNLSELAADIGTILLFKKPEPES